MKHEFATLFDALRWRADQQPEQTAFTFLLDGEQEEASGTYGQLDERARAIAAVLLETGAAGDRALVLHPPGLEFVAALMGCFYAGVVAVPTYPPQFNLRNRSAVRLTKLVQDCQPAVALTTAANVDKGARFCQQQAGLERLRWLATDDIPAKKSASWQPPLLTAEALALNQYTSGSTTWPRGV